MKIEILLHSFKTTNQSLKKGYLKIHFDDYFKISSGQVHSRKGLFIMMQKNTVEMEQKIPNTISFDFVSEGITVARIAIFRKQALMTKQVGLKPTSEQDKNTYALSYSLKMVEVRINKDGKQQQVAIEGLKRRKTLDENAESLSDVKQKVRFLQLGKITYVFAKRLDPLVSLLKTFETIILWKAPQITVSLGILLTIFIIFPKISILTSSICLLFARNYIINYIEKILEKANFENRLLVPQENLQFLKDLMQIYCDVFQKVTDFLREDDKTQIIAIVQLICKCGLVLFFLDLFFEMQTLLVCGLWLFLFSTSTTGRRYIKKLIPLLLHYNWHMNKMIKNVSKSNLVKVLNPSSGPTQIIKQFFIYEHQRWWVGTQWGKSKWSDEKGNQQLQIRIDVPKGWRWKTDWKIQFSQNSDSEGFQYANGIIDIYNPTFGKKNVNRTIRRRKWHRICTATTKMEDHKKLTIQSVNSIAKEPEIMSPNLSPMKSKLKFQ